MKYVRAPARDTTDTLSVSVSSVVFGRARGVNTCGQLSTLCKVGVKAAGSTAQRGAGAATHARSLGEAGGALERSFTDDSVPPRTSANSELCRDGRGGAHWGVSEKLAHNLKLVWREPLILKIR